MCPPTSPPFSQDTNVVESGLAQLVPKQQRGEAGADHQDFATIGQRFPPRWAAPNRHPRDTGEFAFHGDVIGGTLPGFLVGAILACSSALNAAPTGAGKRRQRFIRDREYPAGDLLSCLGSACIEDLAGL